MAEGRNNLPTSPEIQAEVECRVATGRGGESVAVFYRVLPEAALPPCSADALWELAVPCLPTQWLSLAILRERGRNRFGVGSIGPF